MVDIDDILAQYGLQGIAADDEAVEAMQPSEDVAHESELTEVSEEDASNEIFDEVLSEHNQGFSDETASDFSEDLASSDDEDLEDNEDANTDAQNEMNPDDAQSIYLPNNTADEAPSEPTTPSNALIPDNSPTLLLDDATSRFSGAEWYSEIQKANVIIGGMGGISSHLVFNIARMSPAAIVMYDDDVVEMANMSGQLYSISDIGRAKVDAMEDMLRQYTTTGTIYAIRERFTNISEAGDIMLCGFDNMIARKTFFNAWKQHVLRLPEEQRGKCLFLDGRLSLTVMQIFCITGDDTYNMQKYQEKYLFDDSEADETVCSMKQTTYLASMIGATMTNLFTNFVANSLDPVIPYTLPFLTEYDAQYMIFKTEN